MAECPVSKLQTIKRLNNLILATNHAVLPHTVASFCFEAKFPMVTSCEAWNGSIVVFGSLREETAPSPHGAWEQYSQSRNGRNSKGVV
mmetsp:Transcript_25073/g.38316  ORF Transcript_25073/g.38316 Transcript_25073/m.38316 type:complete len:88 (-) Transcript_25073:377-640(-)